MPFASNRNFFAVICLWGLALCSVQASDWTRFRGPNGNGVSPDKQPAPVTWSDTENLIWKLELPGPGHSSPIVLGKRIFLTCWTGYGVDQENRGDQKDLKRHLLCIDRTSGDVLWDKSVPAELPEDRYGGMFAEHGYATHTPVTDAERVYVFFGKSGVHAYDLNGNRLWNAKVGTGLDRRGWGSSSSPIVHEDLLIVTASPESETMFAFDKKTGKEVWRSEAEGYASTWGTPIVVTANDRTDIVLAVPYEIWGINPANGKLRWYCEAIESNPMCSSLVEKDGIIYGSESGRGGGGSVALKVGGKGDASKDILWSSRDRNRIGTPILHDGKMYWISSRVANCVDAKTGDRIYQERLSSRSSSNNSAGQESGRPRGGRGQDYSSPVVADGKMYYVCRNGDMHVIQLGADFKQLAMNRFTSDTGDFSATPAVSEGQLFIRSTKNLYCIAAKK